MHIFVKFLLVLNYGNSIPSKRAIVYTIDYEVAVLGHVNVTISGNNLGDTGYTVVAKNCWVTPDDDVNNSIRYDILIDGCPNLDVSLNLVHCKCSDYK